MRSQKIKKMEKISFWPQKKSGAPQHTFKAYFDSLSLSGQKNFESSNLEALRNPNRSMIPKCLKWWTFLTWPQNWQLFFNYPVSAVSSIFGSFVGLIRSLSNPTKRWHFFIFRTEIFQWPLWAQLLIRIAFSGFFYELKRTD